MIKTTGLSVDTRGVYLIKKPSRGRAVPNS
jgi:hypothetical protein